MVDSSFILKSPIPAFTYREGFFSAVRPPNT